MRVIKYAFIYMLLAIFTGCTYYTPYIISLTDVDRSDDTSELYGGNNVEVIDTLGYEFEDSLLKIIWIPTRSRFNFILSNKTQHSIKIIWDESVYVDSRGINQGVTHLGTKYTDHNSPQHPSIILKYGSIEDMIIPSNNIYYSSGWGVKDLFPNNSDSKSISIIKAAKHIGETVKILLAVESQGTTHEYIFTFRVDGVVLPQ